MIPFSVEDTLILAWGRSDQSDQLTGSCDYHMTLMRQPYLDVDKVMGSHSAWCRLLHQFQIPCKIGRRRQEWREKKRESRERKERERERGTKERREEGREKERKGRTWYKES